MRSKQVQSALNGKSISDDEGGIGLRRARLVMSPGQVKLNSLNLAKLGKVQEDQSLQQDKAEEGNQLQKDEQNVVKEEQKCVLCQLEMNDHEVKISQKLILYTRERGDLRKLLLRIKHRLLQKQANLEATLIDPESVSVEGGEAPLTCFKCQYEMLLGAEGRAKAMRIFNVAQLELEGNSPSPMKDKCQVKPGKTLTQHMISKEMNDLGLMSGTFYDYKKQAAEAQLDLNKSPQFMYYKSTNPLIEKQYQKQNNSVLISLAREAPKDMINLSSIQDLTQNTVKRPWREDFNDKIERKFNSMSAQERQQKILKKIDKERAKYLTGQRLLQGNLELLREHRAKKLRKAAKSQMSQSVMDGKQIQIEDQQVQTTQRSKAVSNLTNQRSLTSTHQHYYNAQVFHSAKKIDRTFFRKLSNLGAFANASFNSGVYINPAQEYA